MFDEERFAAARGQVDGVLRPIGRLPGASERSVASSHDLDVLDLSCGPGRHSIECARRGMRVVGCAPASGEALSRSSFYTGVDPRPAHFAGVSAGAGAGWSGGRDRPVVVAVVAVRMVEVSIDEVVYVIPVGYRLVATAGSMDVFRFVPAARVLGSAGPGVGIRDLDLMLFDLSVLAHVVEVSVVEVVHMIAVLD